LARTDKGGMVFQFRGLFRLFTSSSFLHTQCTQLPGEYFLVFKTYFLFSSLEFFVLIFLAAFCAILTDVIRCRNSLIVVSRVTFSIIFREFIFCIINEKLSIAIY